MTPQERYKQRHPDRVSQQRKKYRLEHGDALREDNRQRERRRRESTLTELLKEVGGKCALCDFADFRALQIDHIADDGHLENLSFRLNSVNFKRHVIESIRRNEGRYQVICANCNWIKEWERRRRLRKQADGAKRPGHAKGDRHHTVTNPECVERGEQRYNAKLNEQKVYEILECSLSVNELAAKFGVDKELIRRVRWGCAWKHVKAKIERYNQHPSWRAAAGL